MRLSITLVIAHRDFVMALSYSVDHLISFLSFGKGDVGSLTVTCRYCVRVLPLYCELYDTLY